MEGRIKKILTNPLSNDVVDESIKMNIPLSLKEKNIEEDNITEIISTNAQFEAERNESGKYRIYGNIKSMVSNVIFNENLKIYRKDGVTQSKYTSTNNIVERNGWLGYIDDDPETAQTYNKSNTDFSDNKSSLCEFVPFDPGYDRLKFDDPDGKPNYLLKVSYPYATEDITLVQNDSGITLADGIPFIKTEEKIINEISYTVFKTPINHGLSVNDTVKLFDIGGEVTEDTFIVIQLGDVNGNNKNRCFVLAIDFTKITFSKGVSRFARQVDGVLSQYYVRKYKTLTSGFRDYDRYPAAFAQSYFGDEEVGFNFVQDIDISGKVDNLGRPLSELFLSIIKVDTDS